MLGTVVQFSYATALTYNVLAGATSITVGDSTLFPPGFGRIRIYNDAALQHCQRKWRFQPT